MKIIDLSALIENSPEDALPFMKIGIQYHSHADGAAQAEALLQVKPELFRNSEGWATETITSLMTHNTTHVDAPWHYNSTIQGERAMTIDELPLEWFFGDGVVMDMSGKKDGDAVTVDDMKAELERIGYTVKPGDIVLVRTGRDAHYHAPDYIFKGPGVTADATRWLCDRGVRVVGIDAWGWDAPLHLQAEEALAKKEGGIFWSAHQADRQYVHMERLVNLGALPPHGFKVACFPLKIKEGSAGPARVVAIIE